jgi:hypothetical protein
VTNGQPGELLDVVRDNDFLTVVSVHGCVFTGDFPHAGVQNFTTQSEEERLMIDLVQNVEEIHAKHKKNHVEANRELIKMLCKFPGLNRLCRLHCSTEPLDMDMIIPRNKVGFYDCFANPPMDESDNKDDQEYDDESNDDD